MTRRILLGKDAGGTFCLRVTRPGFDVLAEDPLANPERFAFASDFDRVERVHQVGSFLAAHNQSVTYATLPYRPLFSIYLREDAVRDVENEIVEMDTAPTWASRFVGVIKAGESRLYVYANQSFSYITLSNATQLNYDYVIWRVPGDMAS